MAKISRDSDVVEITSDPRFDYGQKVKSIKVVRNDGTFPGKDVGEVLVKKGDIGYVTSIGTFLQQFYIYGVDFVASGHRVGMRGKEMEAVPEGAPEAIQAEPKAAAVPNAEVSGEAA